VIVLTGAATMRPTHARGSWAAAQLLTKPVERDLLIRAIDGELGSREKPRPQKIKS